METESESLQRTRNRTKTLNPGKQGNHTANRDDVPIFLCHFYEFKPNLS